MYALMSYLAFGNDLRAVETVFNPSIWPALGCTLCLSGFYAENTGMTACMACPGDYRTLAIGSTSLSACVCPPPAIDDGTGTSTCVCSAVASPVLTTEGVDTFSASDFGGWSASTLAVTNCGTKWTGKSVGWIQCLWQG